MLCVTLPLLRPQWWQSRKPDRWQARDRQLDWRLQEARWIKELEIAAPAFLPAPLVLGGHVESADEGSRMSLGEQPQFVAGPNDVLS